MIRSIEQAATVNVDHYSWDMSDEQLRAAWLLLFGSEAVPLMKLVEEEDNFRLAQTLAARKLLESTHSFTHVAEFYKLKKSEPDGNN